MSGRKVQSFEVKSIDFCRFWSLEEFKERLVVEAADYFLSKVNFV
jgi:hypothetical protein